MLTQSSRLYHNLTSGHKIIPVVETRVQFAQALESTHSRVIMLRHCNLLDLTSLLDNAQRREYVLYVNIDHIDGVHPDAAGFQYLVERLHITGIVSHHPKILALGKLFRLETIQRIFAVDSTGLETSLESVDTHNIDLLDISPAPVIPHIAPYLTKLLPLPFIGSGLISTYNQMQAVLDAGAKGVMVTRPQLWS